MLLISSIRCAVLIYGQSSYSKRITARFSIERYCADGEVVDLVEGHVNKMGSPQRVISFVDSSDNWSISQNFQSLGASEITVIDNVHRIRFLVERVVIEVVGLSEHPLLGELYRGQARLPGNADDAFSIYEVETNSNRRFYLNGSLGVLLKIERCIRSKGECVLIEL